MIETLEGLLLDAGLDVAEEAAVQLGYDGRIDFGQVSRPAMQQVTELQAQCTRGVWVEGGR